MVKLTKVTDRSDLIFKWAAVSRILVVIVSVLSNFVVEDYDTSSQIYLRNEPQLGVHGLFNLFLRTFVRWDAVHFITIAQKGYQFEQQLAFFPGLPVLIRLGASVLRPFTLYISDTSRIVVSGILLANISFVLATWVLYKLSLLLFSEKFAWRTALLFAFTPTPGFMSSIYTEPFFALFTFAGTFYYHKKQLWLAASMWMLASTFRSNGILLAGYLVFDLLFVFKWSLKSLRKSLIKILCFIPQCTMILLPFFSFQLMAYKKLCLENSAELQSPLCRNTIPLAYSYVQVRYWDCGFLRYFKSSETVNFMLAGPLLILSTWGIFLYAKADESRFLTIGLWSNYANSLKKPYSFLQPALLPHIYLWLVMVVYDFTSMHVQVLLRFLTSMPALYWFASYVIATKQFKSSLVIYYWVGYGIVSTTLFANFFPPP